MHLAHFSPAPAPGNDRAQPQSGDELGARLPKPATRIAQ